MTGSPLLPDYGIASLADLLPSVCDGLRVPGTWDVLQLGECDRVVVVVIDGLGAVQLGEHAHLAPTLAKGMTRTITSVFPSTTPTALTSLGTGLAPGEHGLVGASFRYDGGRVLAPLAWRDQPPAIVVQPQPTWWERAEQAGVAVSVVSPRQFMNTGLTIAGLRGGTYVGADGPGERIAMILQAIDGPGRRLVYGYWEALDKTAHIHGVASAAYRAELAIVEQFIVLLSEQLPTDTRLIVTADHGVLDCPDGVGVDDDAAFTADVELVAGEPRMRHVYTRAAAHVIRRWGKNSATGLRFLCAMTRSTAACSVRSPMMWSPESATSSRSPGPPPS